MSGQREELPMRQPLVSVVIPVYNGERYLAATLESVFEQTYRPIEVIVVDDGSTDRSGAIARAFQEVRYLHQSNQGAAVARNSGIANAQGALIAFLDADDTWMRNKLTVQVGYLVDHPDVDYVLARQQIFLEPGVARPPWLKEELLLNDSVGFVPSTLVARKHIFDRIGGFDPAYGIAEDAEWFFRAKDAGIPMAVVPEILLHKRTHGTNLSAHTDLSQPSLLRVVKASIARQGSRLRSEGLEK